jgi:hypothetical protein
VEPVSGASELEEEAFLNISEASRILGVSEAALRQWTDEGKIKASRFEEVDRLPPQNAGGKRPGL